MQFSAKNLQNNLWDLAPRPSENPSLLDKVMLRNQWHIGVLQCHLMFKVTEELHTRPYMVTEKVSEQNISIELSHGSFHNVTYTSNDYKS